MEYEKRNILNFQDAVITKNDATLRKFAAELITEFVSWSLKEASRREEAENFNIKAVIKLICLYSMQPNSYKKLGKMSYQE